MSVLNKIRSLLRSTRTDPERNGVDVEALSRAVRERFDAYRATAAKETIAVLNARGARFFLTRGALHVETSRQPVALNDIVEHVAYGLSALRSVPIEAMVREVLTGKAEIQHVGAMENARDMVVWGAKR